MKRSDMVKLISLRLKLSGNHYCDDDRDLEDAESMLHVLEQYGMTPPAVKEPCPTHYIDATGQVQRGEDSFTFVHRWDDEAPVETSNET